MGDEALIKVERVTALVEKAIENGWKPPYVSYRTDDLAIAIVANVNPALFIFSRNFAKALFKGTKLPKSHKATDDDRKSNMWGEVLGQYSGGGYDGYGDRCIFHGEPWQFRLQQAVISDDAVK